MKVYYLSGSITNTDNYKMLFRNAETRLMSPDRIIINPAMLPFGLKYHQYLDINLAMVRACDVIFMLDGWRGSQGANVEHDYAKAIGKQIEYEVVEK